MSVGYVINYTYLEQHFIGIRRNYMVKWLLPRDNKETRACDSCGTYKRYSQFYNWHHHPALSFLGEGRIGVICVLCAKREAGSKQWKRIKNG